MNFFYATGTAGYVRGEQIADYLGGKKNPTKDLDDTSVYVKVLPHTITKNTYLDIDDAPKALEWLKTHPEVKAIVNSSLSKDYVEKELGRSVIVIPHAHCNYERWVRPDREVKRVGIIGSKTSFQAPLEPFKQELEKIGLELVYEYDYWETYQNNRLKVCEFYKTIDIQVCWRPKMATPYFKNPNKLVNAASFGIPTIAYPEGGFKEWENFYFDVKTIDEMIEMLLKLKTDTYLYRGMSYLVAKKAEDYHISKIIKLYEGL